ncbi:MAG TPA: immunoglobulin domain-containing protein [Verrucomicrobiae bacterium]|jgi:hypothetical protein
MKRNILLSIFTVLASAALAPAHGAGITDRPNDSAVLLMTPPKPTITKEPVSLTVFPGRSATFSSAATNAANYQWTHNGVMLANIGNVSGAYSSVLMINPVSTSDAGSYQVTAYNPYGSAPSSVVKLTVPLEASKPVVTILKPAIGTRSNSIAFSGAVSDSIRVAGVSYVIKNLNNPAYVLTGQAALSSGRGSSNWTFVPGFLSPGTNVLMVQGSNFSGKTTTVTRDFFFRDAAAVSLKVNNSSWGSLAGHASVAGDPAPADGASLYVGEGYTVTATPAAHSLFMFWVTNSVIGPTNRTLSFTMENGLSALAVFETNQFIGMAGRYDGIFSGHGETNSGLIGNLRIGTNGVYSGTLYLAGATYLLHGAFNGTDIGTYNAVETVPRPNIIGSNITLNLILLPGSSPRAIIGSVRSKGWEIDNFPLIAAQTKPQSNSYTMMIFPPGGLGNPQGWGYALITNKNGVLTLGGALADGSAFTESTALGEDGQFSLYANLYNRAGLVLGRGNPSNGPIFPVQWIRPPAKSGLFSSGFNFMIGGRGSVWTPSPATYTNIVTYDPDLVISGADLLNPIDVTFQLPNTITHGEGTNLSSFSFNPANGRLSVVFTNDLHQRITGFGALLQNDSFGGGYYLGTTNDGRFTLTGP